jgi:hypothetical protein
MVGLQVTLHPGDAVEVPAGINHRVTPNGSPVTLVAGVRRTGVVSASFILAQCVYFLPGDHLKEPSLSPRFAPTLVDFLRHASLSMTFVGCLSPNGSNTGVHENVVPTKPIHLQI